MILFKNRSVSEEEYKNNMLREIPSNQSRTSGGTRKSSSAPTTRSTTHCSSTSTAQQGVLFHMFNEQDITRALHNLDRQFRMKDGAPRVLFWSSALKLPCNHEAFRTLSLRRVDTVVAGEAMREVKGLLAFARDERCTTRLWSCLVIHESKVAPIPFIPYLCVAMCRGIPSNPICAFESALHMLGNMCSEWVEAYPNAPMKLLRRVDRYVETHPVLSSLWQFFNNDHLDGGCSLLDYLWVPMQTFLLLNLQPAEVWVQFMDDVVCSPEGSNLFLGAVVALLWQLKGAFFECDTREQVLAVLGTEIREPKAVKQLLQRARNIAAKLVVPLEPIQYLPTRGEYYPLLHVGGRPPIPEKVDKAAKLRQIEEDQIVLERRIAVEVSTLSMNSEMRRFHTSLGQLRCGDGKPATHERFEEKPIDHRSSQKCEGSHENPRGGPTEWEQKAIPPLYTSSSGQRGPFSTAAALSPSNPPPVRLCSLVMEGPSYPVDEDLAARKRDDDGDVFYATTEDEATTHTAPPSEPPLPIMNSMSPPERDLSVVPEAVVRAAALMLASQSMSRQRSLARSQSQDRQKSISVTGPLEFSASLSPTQRGVSTTTASGAAVQQSLSASLGYTNPATGSHAGQSSFAGSSRPPTAK